MSTTARDSECSALLGSVSVMMMQAHGEFEDGKIGKRSRRDALTVRAKQRDDRSAHRATSDRWHGEVRIEWLLFPRAHHSAH